MSNSATADLAGQILAGFTTPVGTAPGFNSLATGDGTGAAVAALQTGVGYAQMIGTKLSNSVTLGVPLAALAVDVTNIGKSYNGNGTISTSDIYSAAANLSAITGGLAIMAAADAAAIAAGTAAVGAGAALSVPVAIGLAIAATATGIALTAAQLQAQGQTIDMDGLMADLKQTVQSAIDIMGSGLADAIDALADAMYAADNWFTGLLNGAGNAFLNFLLPEGMRPIDIGASTFFTAAQKFRFVSDPLTLDLDGDGLETTGTDAGILYDHNADGIKTGTGWVKADDGMLVLDRNGNGSIDTGLELFGDSTVKSNGQRALDGFDALADLDSNADGQISLTDAQFASLRVWRDLNQDGISQGGELFTLASLGIASISTAKTANSQTLANGNQIADLGTYTRTDGSTGTSGDVSGRVAAQQRGTHRPTPCGCNLASDTFHREFTDTLDTSTVSALPDMQGSGVLRDLKQAASQSATLQTLLTQYSAAATREAQLALLDPLLDAWADGGALNAANDGVWRVAA